MLCPHGVSMPVNDVPLCTSCTLAHAYAVPLPELMYVVLFQVVGTVSLSANAPVMSQIVEHTPDEHTAVPPFAGQTWPHMPQLPTVVRGVSQPLRLSPSQLSQPLLHTGTQLPAAQLVVPCGLLQASPHAPQLGVLVVSLISQPSVGEPLQSS